jgi:hypothetical protein
MAVGIDIGTTTVYTQCPSEIDTRTEVDDMKVMT